MTTTIRTSEPRDLLALVPFQLGFLPQESLVLMSVRPPRGEVGLVARADLRDVLDSADGAELLDRLLGHLVDDGAGRMVVVVYTADDARAITAGAALAAAAGCDVEALDVWVVGASGWWSLGCEDPGCCPPGGRSLEDLRSSVVSAAMVLEGATVAPDRTSLADVGEASSPDRRSARRAAQRWTARRTTLGGRTDDRAWRAESLALWTSALASVAGGEGPDVADLPPPTGLGRLRAALDDVLVRDAVLLSLVPGCDGDLPRRVVAQDPDADVAPALRALTDASHGSPPEAATHRAALRLLRAVAAAAAPEVHAPTTTLLAVLAWWAGDGARAAVLLDRVLRGRPDYRLAAIVQEAVRLGVPPGWVAGRRAGGGPEGGPRSEVAPSEIR